MNSYSKQSLDDDDIEAVVEVLKSDYITSGDKVKEFETNLAKYTQSKYCTVVNSATSALHCAYNAIGLKDEDEVITTAMSFASTSNMILECGSKPVFVDILFNGNINPKKIEDAITPKTKAIVSMDYAGRPVDYKAIQAIAKKYNLLWISDSSHSLGSSIDNHKVGSLADITIFSFHAVKPITTGEGGAVVTDNEDFYTQTQLFRSHGIVKKRFWNQDMQGRGFNYRLTDIASALGISQLKKLDTFIDKRKKIANYYNERFKDSLYFTIAIIPSNISISYHLYPIMLDSSLWCPKEDIFSDLKDKNIGVQVHYKPIYKHSFYKKSYPNLRLLNTEDFYRAELSIPCHQNMSLDDAKYVADTLLSIVEKHSKSNCNL